MVLLLCMFQTGLYEASQDWGDVGHFAFCGTFLIMQPFTMQPVKDRSKVHRVESRTCTAGLTHCCFPDSSSAFLCRSRLLLSTPSKVHFVVIACFSSPAPLGSAYISALTPTSGCCSFPAEGEPEATGGQHEAGTGER